MSMTERVSTRLLSADETPVTFPEFHYDYVKVNEMRVAMAEDPRSGKQYVEKVLIDDEPLDPSSRFWNSLFARYGFNSAFFKYFDHAEVFSRISEREPNDRLRFCVEVTGDKKRLLAVSNPAKPLVTHDDIMEATERYNGKNMVYHDGIMEAIHAPVRGDLSFDVSGDVFNQKFLMSTPIDGYGAPSMYLALLREVCRNGTVAYAKSFKTTLSLGKGDENIMPSLVRTLEGFNHEEGYAALRHRIESAATSWASVYESQRLYDLLIKAHALGGIDPSRVITQDTPKLRDHLIAGSGYRMFTDENDIETGSPFIKAFHGMTGDISQLYGLANLDALSAKRQKTLPTKATVYDLINFATEVSTHHANPEFSRKLNGLVGTMISEEYDMEGTKTDRFADFADFHVTAKLEGGLTGSSLSSADLN